jgi:GNAT superfamily N-acetyltransferase
VAVREIRDHVDLLAAARLRWHWVAENRDPGQDIEAFTRDFVHWWEQQPALVGVVAVDTGVSEASRVAEPTGAPQPPEQVVGMAFLVVVNRVPGPGDLDRTSGDLQSVYVVPDHRDHGVGTLMLERLVERARERGCLRITVHSSSRALPYYARLGFERNERILTHPLTPPSASH